MIYFADKNNTYAMNMHAGMQDVIDGSRAYFERTVGFNANATSFDIRANLTRFEFAINMPLLDVQDLSAYIKIEQDDKTYYAFVVDYAVINDKTTLVKFEIDWWHTSFVGQSLPTLERAWISRDNKHDVIATDLTHNGKTVYEVLCGEGEESVNPLNLQTLASSIPQGACIEHRTTPIMTDAEITHDLDDRLIFVRIITTKLVGGRIASPITTPLYNSLQVGYIMFVNNPIGVDINSYKVQGTQFGSVRNEIYKVGAGATLGSGSTLNLGTAWLGEWAKEPNTVSIDVVGYMPVIKSIEKQVVDGLTYYYINFIDSDNDTTFYLNETPPEATKLYTTFSWFGDLPTPKFYTPLTYDMLHELGILHTTDSYSHTNGEDLQDVVEPKFAQPQYSSLRVTNYKSEGVQVNPYNAFNGNFSLIESGYGNIDTLDIKTRIDQSYNEPTAQSSYAPIGAMNGEMLHSTGDDEGYRDISQVDTSLNELPIINDQYLTYMQNKRNSFQTGYALQQRQLDINSRYALAGAGINAVGGITNLGVGAGKAIMGDYSALPNAVMGFAKSGFALGQTIETTKYNRDALQQTHNAFIADLKNAVKGVKGGNNAVYAVSRGDLWLTWELWQVTPVDKIRLHDYFKYNGYARNEMLKQVSLDSMYYFDYLEADNITFKKGLTLGAIALNAIRSQLSNGVRIWHERGGAFMHTDFMNTAKDF